jgi:hypothetical protein
MDNPNEQRRRITDHPDMPMARRMSLENRMDALEEKLDKNNELTETIVDIFGTAQAGLKVLGWLGAAVKWTVTVAGACAALWALVHGKDVDLPK